MRLNSADSTRSKAKDKPTAQRRTRRKIPATAASDDGSGTGVVTTPRIASVTQLTTKLIEYLTPEELKQVRLAYRFADEKHLGQMRVSGLPYISHPIAVAEICADWKLDAQAIMAALLHDVMEDQNVPKDELTERFGAQVSTLVDGLSKLDKLEFQTQIDMQAENFRKMLLAMARDVRVILVKLADRLHNMRTLDAMSTEKRHRIARETMEVYVPIAHRLGLNNIYRELQDLAFLHMNPLRYRTLSKAIKAARGNRRAVVSNILDSVNQTLAAASITSQVFGREKTLYGIYRKMRNKHLSFSQVLDIYGFRIVVDSFANCYVALGTLHAMYKPMPGKFKDYIAIPKLNGYQSLHTTLIGPYGTPVEFQIRTQEMHRVAESGVAAHWLYKNEDGNLTDLQQRTHAWLQSLLDIQKQTGDSAEFLEHVKIDLFPDSVYVFTPTSEIVALPRGATALDFAYNIHTDIGHQTIAAKINHEQSALRTELRNGDIVEIITSPTSRPTPTWLGFVRTGKARSAIRHHLRTANLSESQELGKRLLAQALTALNLEPALPPELVEKLLGESSAKSLDNLYIDIGIGKRMASLVARHIHSLTDATAGAAGAHGALNEHALEPVTIDGSEGVSVQLAPCCLPIPGDKIIGQLKKDQGLLVHSEDCYLAKRQRVKEPERWIDVAWAGQLNRRFDCRLKILVHNHKGVLAQIAVEIGESDADISSVSMEDHKELMMTEITFMIQVENRVHLARLIRNMRNVAGVTRILRDRG